MNLHFHTFSKQLATGAATTTTALLLTVWQAPTPAFADSVPVIVCQHDGIDALMPDDRDAGLRRAVSMLALRLKEIPGEIQQISPNGPPPEVIRAINQIIPLISATFQYPAEWAVLDNGINDFGVTDFDARVVIDTGSRAEAEKLNDAVSRIFQMAMPNATLQPADSNPNFLAFPTPFATFLFGPVDEQGLFAMGLDLGGDGINIDRITLTPPSEFGSIHPAYQFHVSARGVMNIVEFAAGMAPDPSVKEKVDALSQKMEGISINLDMAGGYHNGESISVTKVTNFKAFTDLFADQIPNMTNEIGFISQNTLKNIPEDARMASAGNQNLQTILHGVIEQITNNSQGAVDVDQFLQQIKQSFGVNPMEDIVDHLGNDWVSYTADSSGGGGLMSLVMLNKGADTDALQQSFDQLHTTFNGIAAAKALGYVRCRAWDGDGWKTPGLKAGYTLTFPGLPVPLELSLGLTDDCLIAGITPQAVQAAVLQCSGKTHRSILDNPRFAAAVKGELDHVSKLSFVDSAACIARGYPLAQLLGTAVENFVRSPSDPSRDPGIVVPSYNDLARNAHGFMQISRISGNDFVQITKSDTSWFVNIAGISGALGITPEAIGAGALGAAIGANAH